MIGRGPGIHDDKAKHGFAQQNGSARNACRLTSHAGFARLVSLILIMEILMRAKNESMANLGGEKILVISHVGSKISLAPTLGREDQHCSYDACKSQCD